MHDQRSKSEGASPLQPLTKRTKKDEAYVRPEAIEQEIIAALDRPIAHLIRASAAASSGCLVYFARHYRSPALVDILLDRAKRVVRQHIGHIPEHRRADVQEWVRDEFLARLMSDADDADFFEAQFDLSILALRTDAIRRFAKQDRVETAEAFASAGDDAAATDALDRYQFKTRSPLMNEAEVNIELRRLRALLTDKEFRAMHAHHMLGLDIESIDPAKTTVATLMGVSGRQIRTYLKSALDKAAQASETGE